MRPRLIGAVAGLILVIAAAGGVVGCLVARGGSLESRASTPVSFPGLESGARDAANRGLAEGVDASSTREGIQLKVVGFVADETQTVVSYVLTGREAEGGATNASAPVLIDADGNSYRSTRGSANQDDPRHGSSVFPAIPAKAGTLTFTMDGIALVRGQTGESVTTVPGTWRVQFEWDGKKAPPGPQVAVSAAPQPFGPGSVSITRVQQSATATLVSGTLDGFPAAVIQSMGCPAADLGTADGGSVQFIDCRLGFGEGYRSFEINYPPTSGKVKINFVLSFTPHGPPGLTLPADFKATEGAKGDARPGPPGSLMGRPLGTRLRERGTIGASAAACLLAAAALVSACGGPDKVKADSPESYADASCTVVEAAFEGAGEIDLTIDPAHPEEAQRSFAVMASASSQAAERLIKIEPPEEIAAWHQQIVEYYRDSARAFKDIEKSLDQQSDHAAGTAAAIEAEMAARPDPYARLPDSYQRAFENSERCKRLWTPTAQ